jgi:tetratricopeptide (TPR) repeat protein
LDYLESGNDFPDALYLYDDILCYLESEVIIWRRRMKTKQAFSIFMCVFVLASCASLGFLSSARRSLDEGMGYFNTGNYAEAIPHFEEAIELDPEFGEAYLYLGRSYLNLGRWLDALQPLRTALRLAPAETKGEALNLLVDALFGAGIDRFKKGDFSSSIDYFKEVLDLQPDSGRAREELFGALMGFGAKSLSEGDPAEAISAFSEALTLSPNDVNAYISLAKAFFVNGDYMKSLQTVRNLLNVDPANSEAQSLLMQLLRR